MNEKVDSHGPISGLELSGSEGAGNTASEPDQSGSLEDQRMAEQALTPDAGDRQHVPASGPSIEALTDQAGPATAQIKAATLTMTLKADSGYESVETHRVSPDTWAQIVALASGGAA